MKRKLRGFAAILGVTVMMVLFAGCGESTEKETKEIFIEELKNVDEVFKNKLYFLYGGKSNINIEERRVLF